jgi:hypothetical protein
MIFNAINPRPSRMDLHANSLLADTFSHPSEVLSHPLLSAPEKRCVLAAWASDAFAVEGSPWLRQLPGGADPIPVGEISPPCADLTRKMTRIRAALGRCIRPYPDEAAMAVGF